MKSYGIPIIASIILLMIGAFFKLEHWPYGNDMILIAFSSITLFYFLRFGKKPEKKLLDWVKLGLITFWSINGIFLILHLPYRMLFRLLSSVFFFSWILLEGFQFVKLDKGNKKRSISNRIYILATIIGLAGIVFKIMQWPYASILIMTGLGIAAVWMCIDFFNTDWEEENESNSGNK